jgi:HD-GYP domain-containing protein (c-di-GMP phosphodiesterase class II)
MPLRPEIRRTLLQQSRDDACDVRLSPVARLSAARRWTEMALTEDMKQAPLALELAASLVEPARFEADERRLALGIICAAWAEYYYYVGEFRRCETSAREAEQLLNAISPTPPLRWLVFAKRFCGLARSDIHGPDRALEDFFAALDDVRTKQSQTTPEELLLLAEVGSCYAVLSLPNDAAEVFDEALALLPSVHDPRATFVVNSYAVGSFCDQHRYSDAIACGEAALAVALSVGATRWFAVASARLAMVHLELGSFELAHELLQRALTLSTQIGYTSYVPWVNLRIARVFQNEGRWREAHVNALAAHSATKAQRYAELQRQSLEVLAEACRHLGDTDGELRYQRQLLVYERQIFGRDTRSRLLDFTVKRAAARAQRRHVELEARIVTASKDIEQAQYETLERLAIAAEARDAETAEHTYRVGHVSAAIAAQMGLPSDLVEQIRFAARLHDIGKIGIPDHIMLKPGALSDTEYEIIKTHTIVGARILSGGRTDIMRMAESVAASHHEAWSGGGYPYGLIGEQIPLAGRITTVADVFDALTHARPYKAAWQIPKALDEIRFLSGKKFQPEVVEAFLRVVSRQSDFIEQVMALRVA